MNKEKLDIVYLIEKNPLIKLDDTYQSKMLEKIKSKFTIFQQRLYVANYYCSLNYDEKKDFVIDLNDIWKWLGFNRKDDCKRVLKKNFVVNIDYIASQVSNKETFLLSVNTFKKLCLKSNTKKADEIQDYYIQLRDIMLDIVNEESNEFREQFKV